MAIHVLYHGNYAEIFVKQRNYIDFPRNADIFGSWISIYPSKLLSSDERKDRYYRRNITVFNTLSLSISLAPRLLAISTALCRARKMLDMKRALMSCTFTFRHRQSTWLFWCSRRTETRLQADFKRHTENYGHVFTDKTCATIVSRSVWWGYGSALLKVPSPFSEVWTQSQQGSYRPKQLGIRSERRESPHQLNHGSLCIFKSIAW